MERSDIRIVDLKELIKPLTEIEKIKEIYIFGSRAYNTGSLRSDIDILIYAPEGVTQYEMTNIIKKRKSFGYF